MRVLKHSKQRDSIKEFLSGRRDHPTADVVYMNIRREYPNISLGTVYRNLSLLASLGEIQKLSCGDGVDHFDPNTKPHYHFLCRDCGSVLDVPVKPLEELNQEAQKEVGGSIEGHTTVFYGTCSHCSRQENSAEEAVRNT